MDFTGPFPSSLAPWYCLTQCVYLGFLWLSSQTATVNTLFDRYPSKFVSVSITPGLMRLSDDASDSGKENQPHTGGAFHAYTFPKPSLIRGGPQINTEVMAQTRHWQEVGALGGCLAPASEFWPTLTKMFCINLPGGTLSLKKGKLYFAKQLKL